MFLHLFRSFFDFFNQHFGIFYHTDFVHVLFVHVLLSFYLKYFLSFAAIIIGMVFLISVFPCLLLVYRNMIDFCLLILYPITLRNSLISSRVHWDFFLHCHLSFFMSFVNKDNFISFFSNQNALYLFFLPYCSGYNFQYYLK